MSDAPVLRLGFIGLGQAMNLILQRPWEIAGLPIKIVAGADPREQALVQFERDFGGEVYDNAVDLCRSPNVDIVYIATGPEIHRELAVMAAEHGKHMIVEKPLALTIEDCQAMVAAADRHGVRLLAGHTHSFGAPYRKMREIVRSGDLGPLVMINSWMFNEFNPRPWPTRELESTHGPLLNQGPHQVDIVRQIGGGLVRSVRANTFWDPLRDCLGGYVAYLEFDGGIPATMVFDARGFFDTAELHWWIGEGGQPREPDRPYVMRRNFKQLAALGRDRLEEALEAQKEAGRYGAQATPESWARWGYTFGQENHQPFFGFNLVSCERGALRQSADGLYVYGEEERTEISLEGGPRGRAAELMELYNAVVHQRPMFHDGCWGMATLEVCLSILESAKAGGEVRLQHQVSIGD